MSIPGIAAWKSDNYGLAFEIVWHKSNVNAKQLFL